MEVLKKAVMAVVIIAVLVFGGSFFISPDFKIVRSIEIDATQEEIFQYIVDLEEWRNWAIWFERDPNMQVEYSGPAMQVGMKSEWVSVTEGSGNMIISVVEPNKRMIYALSFPEFGMQSTGELVLSATREGKTEVTWMDYGTLEGNSMQRYFLLGLDNMLGPDFEAGLFRLKKLSEK